MRAPDFWWRPAPSFLARLLSPFGAFYGARTLARMGLPGKASSIPVICVGNPVAGGAGKTPAAIEIARLLNLARRNPVFLTRGYGGKLEGPVRVDPKTHTARDVGDEPLLLCRTAPCVVAHDRVSGAALAAKFGDVIVMDDGFQNPSLKKDMSLLVIDTEQGIGNGLCIPAGPLRAPIEDQLARADAVILIGEGKAAGFLGRRKKPPQLAARLVPDAKLAGALKGRRVLAFAGIGRPQKFSGTLKALGADVVRLAAFGDHHVFTVAEARALLDEAAREDLTLVTTEKDFARLTGPELKWLADKTYALPVRLAFDNPKLVTSGLKKLFG
ncbi:tetraacyldisaccharide 4'-kinase [Terrihabitans soli]|uniref:Tetraacyldisaccharide 4'-kinase n=1 Tax=Terrihabitans soli TaxID=708113 RepID=A0A6S6QXA3_9HYPH|nr:tetraacyldisaccharide 4'-kinase [Terrihabitans soli]BCJ91670.1 tetraacyldisaccharide 4'-kinase [Terrihabitans soli]